MLCGSWPRTLAATHCSGIIFAMKKRASIDSYFQRLPDTAKKQLTSAAFIGKAPAAAADPAAPSAPLDAAPAAGAAPAAAAGAAPPSHVVAASAAAGEGEGGKGSSPRPPRPRSPVRKPAAPWKKQSPPPQQQQQQQSPAPTGAATPGDTGDAGAVPPAAQAATQPPSVEAAAAADVTPQQAAAETAAAADAAKAPPKGASAMQKLMAGAKAQAKSQAAAAADAPPQLTPEEMGQRAASNQEAVSAALAAAAAAGRPPLLKELLVESSWLEVLGGEFDKPYMAGLQSFLDKEWAQAGTQVFPPKDSIFRAFNSVPFDQVRVVILGQDPYHQPGNAMGLSFSVPPGRRPPQSLLNMYKELATDCGVPPSSSGDLTPWCRQGVLLLNAMLTVREAAAGSHARKGWEAFTDAAIAALSSRRRGVVFLLWGNFAITKGARVDKGTHHVLTAAHPSPLAASRGFFGCKHFSKANQLLQQSGQRAIDWRIS